MQVYIKKISFTPVRYLIYQTGVDWASPTESIGKLYIGSITFKKFFKGKVSFSSAESSYIDDDYKKPVNISNLINSKEKLKEVAQTETKILQNEMYSFLANQETSPAKLEGWLRQRNVPDNKCKEYMEEAREQKFISLERYLEAQVEKKYLNAKEPWWLVAKGLSYELEKYSYLLSADTLNNFSSVKEFIEAHAFDDLMMLQKNYRLPQQKPIKSKFTKQLLTKGFSHSVIVKYLAYLDLIDEDR